MSNPHDPAAPPPPTWNVQTTGPATVAYGGFWIRVVAYIIDYILIKIGSTVVETLTGTSIDTHNLLGLLYFKSFASVVVAWLYFALLESSARGATVGKMAVGLRVVTDKGERLSFFHATGRYLAKIISALMLGIGFLMVAFTDRKRGAHDMIANTLVIKVG